MQNLGKRFIAGCMSLVLVLEPIAATRMVYKGISLALPYAMPALIIGNLFRAEESNAQPVGVTAGKSTGQASLNLIRTPGNLPVMSGSTQVVLPTAGGLNVKSVDVFQERGEVTTDAASAPGVYGSTTNYDNLVQSVVTRIEAEPSTQGDAYRTMMDSKRRRVDYNTASFLDKSKDVWSTPFTGCTQSETTTPTPKPYTFQNKKQCTRVVTPPLQTCDVTRLYTINQPAVTGDVVFDTQTSTKSIWPNQDWGTPGLYQQTKGVSIDWGKLQRIAITDMRCDDECSMKYKNGDIPGDTWHTIPIATTNSGNTSCGERSGQIIVAPGDIDITAYVSGITNLLVNFETCINGTGGSRASMKWESNVPLYQDNGFLQVPTGCWDKQFASPFCKADSWTCSDSNSKYAGGQLITLGTVKGSGGKAIWSDASPYENTAFETPNVCWKAAGEGLCNATSGPIGCFTDVNGNTQCPNNDGSVEQDTCADVEAEGCVFESETCVDGAYDAVLNTCYAYTGTYNCGGDTVNIGGNVSTTTSINCAATRCMGVECMTKSNEKNESFGIVNGLLGNMNSLGQDAQCNATGCKLFGGKPLECKTALGGTFDCCNKTIPGVNWMDYLKLSYASYKAAQAQGIVGELPSISGIGHSIAQGVAQTVDSLAGTTWTSSLDAMSAGSTSGATTSLTSTLVSELTDQLAEWAFENFGTEVAGSLFEMGASGNFVLTEGAQSVLNTVGTVFMYAYIAYLVLSIIFACGDTEFELAAQKQLKNCHYVGSYCSGSTLGVCWEKKEAWCCYGSALSRIMQEQIRMQILGWGDAKNPQCGGLTTGEMALVNWGAVNLSEYTAMVTMAGIKPKSGEEAAFYSMDNITKQNVGGATYDVGRGPGSPGVNTVDSIQNAANSTDVTGIENDKERMKATNAGTAAFPPPPP